VDNIKPYAVDAPVRKDAIGLNDKPAAADTAPAGTDLHDTDTGVDPLTIKQDTFVVYKHDDTLKLYLAKVISDLDKSGEFDVHVWGTFDHAAALAKRSFAPGYTCPGRVTGATTYSHRKVRR
jgi:hypothetical protein